MLNDKIQLNSPLRVNWDLREVNELDNNLTVLYGKVNTGFLFEFNLFVNGNLFGNGLGGFWESKRKSLSGVNLTIVSCPNPELADSFNHLDFKSIVVDWSDLSRDRKSVV